jgi:hypothetical protein
LKTKLLRRFIIGLIAGVILSSIIAKAEDSTGFSLELDPNGISAEESAGLALRASSPPSKASCRMG